MDALPIRARKWAVLAENEGVCMYPPPMHTLSEWELQQCPWWIDLDSGHTLEREKEIYKKMKMDHRKDEARMKNGKYQ